MIPSTKQKYWQQHINQWRKSGLSQAQYCKDNSIKESAFSYHKCRLTNGSVLVEPKKSGFLQLSAPQIFPAHVSLSTLTHEPLTLHLAKGLSISGIALNNLDLVKQLSEMLS